MSKTETDISQIRKYLNGELDAKAMHRLERRAQADPFLMDALEGYQSTKNNQQPNLDDLAARLKQRMEPKRGRIIPFRLIGIAASVLIVCSVGTWWLMRLGEQRRSLTAVNITQAAKPAIKTDSTPVAAPSSATPAPLKPEVKPALAKPANLPVVAADAIVKEKPPTIQDLKAAHISPAGNATVSQPTAEAPVDTSLFVRKASPIASNGDILKKIPPVDSAGLSEMIVMQYKGKKKDSSASNLVANNYKSPVQKLVGQAPGVTVNRNPNFNTPASVNGVQLPQGVRDAANDLIAKQMIKGEVISRDGQPLADVKVKVAGTNTATYTDKKGRFTLKADSTNSDVVIESKGYQKRQASANSRDSAKKITTEPASEDDLAEVVVTGYTTQAKDGEQATVIFSHPQDGWGSYRKYLKRNAVSPDGHTGTVKVSFMVDRLGSVSDIKVLRGLDDATNKKAVNIIKDGPGWIGNSDKKPEKVTLRIRFVK